MDHENVTRAGNNQKSSKSFNKWKWAFLILFSLVLALILWLGVQVLGTESSSNVPDDAGASSQLTSQEVLQFEVRSEKEQLEELANQYLDAQRGEGGFDYHLYLDQQVQMQGELELFGIPVPFELNMDPYVMEDGNLQLRATSISLGNLNLPVSFVMSQLQRQLDLPSWVTVHPESQFIVLNFTEFQLNSGIHFSMEYINLSDNDIRINVFVPKDNG